MQAQIRHCDIYHDQSTCAKCLAHFYLQANHCLAVESSDVIAHCRHYSSATQVSLTQCEACEPSHLLVDNRCQEIKARNCLDYDDHNSCKTCPMKHGLKADPASELKHCEPIGIPDCLWSSTEYPFRCDTCSRGYFVDNNTCVLAPRNIDNCKYLEVVECKHRRRPRARSATRTISSPKMPRRAGTCRLPTGTSMPTARLGASNPKLFDTAELSCSFCEFGYYMDSAGACQSCAYGLETGCLVCEPSDPAKCMMCAPGHYMDTGWSVLVCSVG